MKKEIRIERLFRIWRQQRLVETCLFAIAAALPAGAMIIYWTCLPPLTGVIIAGAVAGMTGIARWRFAGFHLARSLDIAFYLNRLYPGLEQSAELLLLPEEPLPELLRRQRHRVEKALSGLEITLPYRLGQAVIGLILGLALSLGIKAFEWPQRAAERLSLSQPHTPASRLQPSLPPEIGRFSVIITPPSYTNLPAIRSNKPEIEAPAGSILTWELAFSPAPRAGEITTGEGQNIPLKKNAQGRYTASLRLERTGFYSIQSWNTAGDTARSPYHPLIARQDAAPKIRIEGLAQYFEYTPDPNQRIAFTVYLNDDYGISDARLVATVAKGEGESVTFREDTLRFAEDFGKKRKSYVLKKSIRLGELGMKAGDELYLHLEADDNHRPAPQTAKTAKYIIAFEGLEQEPVDMAGKLAVDRLPEYFRSQRQIIIDTEKLLAESSKADAVSFRERSNNIAIDQKLLRLRYGQFLGEEAVTIIGEGADLRASEETGYEDKEEAHDHEAQEEGHSHAGAAAGPETAATAGQAAELEPFMHIHDNVEEATFFDAATTAKLRAALAQMWDAELHLRLAEPAKALPFEYRALRLIKEIQQASRIYVERTGFDPPVIDVAGKRLTGELNKIKNTELRRTNAGDETQAVEAAIRILESLRRQAQAPGPAEKARLQAAGKLLATRALEQPGPFLLPLQYLRQIIDQTAPPQRRDQYLQALVRTFWNLLPDRRQQPLKEGQREGQLRDLFWRELEKTDDRDR